MKRFGYLALLLALFSLFGDFNAIAAEKSKKVYLEVWRSPPNRHVIAMKSMEDCKRAIAYSSAKCVYSQPRLPDSSTGVFRTLDWAPPPVDGFNPTSTLNRQQ